MSLPTMKRMFPYVVTAGVLVAVVAGLILMGPPGEQRQRRLDRIRTSDLERLAFAIDGYWRREGRLPDSLEALRRVPNAAFRSTVDPISAQPYTFRTLGETTYELCASFELEGGDSEYDDRFWAHPAGATCFRLDAKKRLPGPS